MESQSQHFKQFSVSKEIGVEKRDGDNRLGAIDRKTEGRRRMTENRKQIRTVVRHQSSVLRQLEGPKKVVRQDHHRRT